MIANTNYKKIIQLLKSRSRAKQIVIRHEYNNTQPNSCSHLRPIMLRVRKQPRCFSTPPRVASLAYVSGNTRLVSVLICSWLRLSGRTRLARTCKSLLASCSMALPGEAVEDPYSAWDAHSAARITSEFVAMSDRFNKCCHLVPQWHLDLSAADERLFDYSVLVKWPVRRLTLKSDVRVGVMPETLEHLSIAECGMQHWSMDQLDPAVLTKLDLRGSAVTDDLIKQIIKFRQLTELTLGECGNVTPVGYRLLGELPLLRLQLNGARQLDDQSLATLSHTLTELWADCVQGVTASGVEAVLARCPKLTGLLLHGELGEGEAMAASVVTCSNRNINTSIISTVPKWTRGSYNGKIY